MGRPPHTPEAGEGDGNEGGPEQGVSAGKEWVMGVGRNWIKALQRESQGHCTTRKAWNSESSPQRNRLLQKQTKTQGTR